MKRIILLFVWISLLISLSAQTQLMNPESIVWNPNGNYWLIANTGSGEIVKKDGSGNSTVWNSDLTSVRGIYIDGAYLYCASTEGLVKIDLATAQIVQTVVLPSQTFLNDITTDGTQWLYITDTDATAVHKVSLADLNQSQIITTNIAGPNGIYYDGENNRLIVAGNGTARIKAIDLDTYEVTNLTTASVSSGDGITRDRLGNWYASSWGTGIVYKYTPDFQTRTNFITSVASPADIGVFQNVMAIPRFNLNNVVYVPIDSLFPPRNLSFQPMQNGTALVSWNSPNYNLTNRYQFFKNDSLICETTDTTRLLTGLVSEEILTIEIKALYTDQPSEGLFDSFVYPVGNADPENVTATNLIKACYPNPFNSETTLKLDIKDSAEYSLAVYDIRGRQVLKRELSNIQKSNEVKLPLQNQAAGIYFVKVFSSDKQSIKKIVHL